MKVILFSFVCTIDFYYFLGGKLFFWQSASTQCIRFVGYFCSESVERVGTQRTMYYQETGDFLVMERNIIEQ